MKILVEIDSFGQRKTMLFHSSFSFDFIFNVHIQLNDAIAAAAVVGAECNAQTQTASIIYTYE